MTCPRRDDDAEGGGQGPSRSRETLRLLASLARAIAGNADLRTLIQAATDAATEASGARFGAFFRTGEGTGGGTESLSILAGTPRSAFEALAASPEAAAPAIAFDGTRIVRAADIRKEPRSGSGPLLRLPEGLPPVASCLAVPVVSRTGEMLGCLLVAHDAPDAFTEEDEEIVDAIAAHAAIAIDGARLFERLEREGETRRKAGEASARLAAIVESSHDAILSKSLEGIISSWNASAQRLFGYSAEEAIGRPITMLIPPDRLHEEDEIIGRIRQGLRVDHYETVRRRKDGSLIDIALTVSPVRDEHGAIIGASKIARDITERKRAQERQTLLLREMNHRIKNLFALTNGLVSLSARASGTVEELAANLRERISALARAHALTLPDLDGEIIRQGTTTLTALLKAILAPHDEAAAPRIAITGADAPVQGGALTALALLLHEFATNAAKYGALAVPDGRLSIAIATEGDMLSLTWVERGGRPADGQARSEGFGSRLERAAVQGTLGGEIVKEWTAEGLTVRLKVPLGQLRS